MKTMKMALMAGAAVAVSAAAAHADELQDLKAQVEALNARVAAMETAPAVPAGYQLLAISKGEALQVPGMLGSDRDRVVNDRATIISVMPTADAPAGTTISWSGYVRAAIVYSGDDGDRTIKRYEDGGDGYALQTSNKSSADNDDDWDVKSRGQLRVVATTDTAVGEVGVELKMRADLNGNGTSDVYMKTAWGYWAMTPELTLGGGYSGSLGNIGYGYDGACTCYYTDNADVGFDPGDTTQMRLSYASGPFAMAIAIEDASLGKDGTSGNNLGAAGEIKYTGDSFSGEISGVYRTVNEDDYNFSGKTGPRGNFGLYSVDTPYAYNADLDSLWQIGAGVGFNMGDIASLSLAAAMGHGPFQETNSSGDITESFPITNDWWGVSGLATANLSDAVHAEFGAGYKHREGDSHDGATFTTEDGPETPWKYSGFDYDTWALLGGVYYTPVDQLTIGLEGEWYTTDISTTRTGQVDTEAEGLRDKIESSNDNWTIDLVSVWRF
ncbi:MAG: hypothetical protein IOC82_06470 [Aestuariivirga sp.]|uniref:hypothetical protein n=1 Tax=Aestuariivirga sp. TaxID=2650926 RepID=UPI0025BC4BC0|nr:hypothetical protein [Aestuariivirga sp.]MCA3560660.1 hypothetical protein [Aestuariivirga sp.]